MALTAETDPKDPNKRDPKDPGVVAQSPDSPQPAPTPAPVSASPYSPTPNAAPETRLAPHGSTGTFYSPQDRLLDIYEHSKRVDKLQGEYGEVPSTTRYAPSQLVQDLDAVLKEVGKQGLPPEVAIAISQMNLYETDKQKAAQLLAQEFALPLRMVIPKVKDKKGVFHWVDPMTGQEISLATARRIAPHLEASVIYQQLSSTPGSYSYKAGRGRVVQIPGQDPIDPIWTAAGVGVLSKHFGDDLSYRSAMAAAIGMAQTETDLNLVDKNLENILANGVASGHQAIALAHTAAAAGTVIHNREEALRFLASADPRSLDPGTLEEAIRDAKKIDSNQNEAASEGLDSGWASVRGGVGNIVTQDEQYEASTDSVKKTFDILYGGQPVRKALKEYNRIATEILDTIEQEDYDNEHSIIGRWMGRAGGFFEEIAHPFRGVAAQVISRADYIYASTWGALMWDDYDADAIETQFNKDIAASEKVFAGDKEFVRFLTEDKGFSMPAAMFMDFAVTWYADPLIVGGKILHLNRSAKFFQFSKLYNDQYGAVRWINFVDKVVDKAQIRLGFKSPARFAYDNIIETLDRFEGAVPPTRIQKSTGRVFPERDPSKIIPNVMSGDTPIWALDKDQFVKVYKEAQKRVDAAGGVDNLKRGDSYRRLYEKFHDVELPRGATVDDLFEQWQGKKNEIAGYFQDKIRASFQQRWSGQDLDPYFLNYIFDHVRTNRALRTADELIGDISDMWKVGLGAKPAEGTAAYAFLRGWHDDIARRSATDLTPSGKRAEGLRAVTERMELEDAEDLLYRDFLDGYGSTHYGNMMHYAPRATIRGIFRRLGRAVPGQDTRALRGMRAAFNRSSGNIADLEKNLPQFVDRMLTRSREFSRAEIRAWSAKAAHIMRPKNPTRNADFSQLIEDIQKEIIWREARNLGIDKRLAEDIVDVHLQKAQEATDNLFGAGEDAMFDATGAQIETQLRNRLVMVDPVQVRRTLHEMLTYRKSVLQWGRRFAPGLKPKEYDLLDLMGNARYAKETGKLIYDEVNDVGKVIDTWQRGRDAFLRVWKPAVVVTPRYILRVPLGDETLRYFSDLSVWSRFQNSALGSRLGLTSHETFNFTLDITRTNEVVRNALDSGFDSVDEAVEAIARSKDPRLPMDERISNLSPQVREWLDGAVVTGDQGVFGTLAVDETGAPLTLYHSGGVRISQADRKFVSNITPKHSAYRGRGYYFSTSVDHARDLQHGIGTPAPLSEVQLYVTNPLDYDKALRHNEWSKIKRYMEVESGRFKKGAIAEIEKGMKDGNITSIRDLDLPRYLKNSSDETLLWQSLGYDSMRIRDGNIEGWVAFDPADVRDYGKGVEGIDEAKQLKIEIELDIPPAYDLPNDPSAVGGIHASEIYETMSQMSRRQAKEAKRNWVRYNVHDMGEAKYSEGWAHVLSNQYGRSSFARRVLKSITNGHAPETAVDDVLDWLRHDSDGRAIYEQLWGHSPDDIVEGLNPAMVDAAVEARVRQIFKDTMNDPILAHKALQHEATPQFLIGYMTSKYGGSGSRRAASKFLRRTNTSWYNDAPVIHSIDAERAAGLKYHVEQVFDNVARSILELPTNHLVRHPFFNEWYTRARKQMLRLAETQGQELSEALQRSIDAEARKFAQARVRDVMFDFKEQARIAEMMSFVAPFMQPFMEAYTVWGRLLADKPQLLGYANHIWKYISDEDSGIVKADKFSGEKYINLGWFGPAKILNNFFPGPAQFPGWSVSGNIANINMFVASTMELDTNEWTGGFLPDLNIPIPGFSPPVHYVVEQIVKSDLLPPSMKWKAFDYAMQYGSTDWTSTLPMWLRNASVALGVIPNDQVIDSYAIDLLKMRYLQGLTPQKIAKAEGISVDRAKTMMVETAKEQARDLFGWRALFSLFLPTSPRIDMPTKELENEYLDYLQGNTQEEALALLKKNNPDLENLEAFTAASTYWAGTRDGQVYYDAGAVALPANRAVDMMLDNPEFKTWARQNPETAFMFIPDEFWELGFDRESYFTQVDNGWRKVKDPLDFLHDIDIQEGFAQYRALTDSWNNSKEWMLAKGIDYDSVTWGTGVGKHIGQDYYLTEIARIQKQHPAFAQYGQYREGLGIDIQHDIKWKEVLQNPAYQGTDMGQAISQWIKGRDRIIEDMQAENVYGTDAPGFYELGFDKRVENLKNEVFTAHPGFQRAYYVFFDEEFTRIKNVAWQENAREIKDEKMERQVFNWERKFDKALENAKGAIDDADAVPYYLAARKLSLRAEHMDFNPQEIWWANKVQIDKDKLKFSTRFRPFSFLSKFDRETILGIKTDDAAESAWLQVGMWDARIAKFGDDFPWESRKEMYENRDAGVRQLMASSPTFKNQVEAANTWGYGFFYENDLLKGEQPSAKAWRAFKQSLANMQRQADAKDMVGDNDFDSQRGALYASMRNTLEDHVENVLFPYSDSFKRQWKQAQDEYGGRLMEYFMPEWYFPLGGHESR